MIKNLIGKLKKQGWTFTFIGTDNLDVMGMAADMGIDNHLSFSEDAKGTEEMFKHERMSRERFNLCWLPTARCRREAISKSCSRNLVYILYIYAAMGYIGCTPY